MGSEWLNDPRHGDGMPPPNRIQQQTETRRLVHNFLIIARLKRPLMGKKEAPGQLGATFPPLALEWHPAPERGILAIPQEGQRLEGLPSGGQGFGEAIRGRPPGPAR